MVISVSLIFRVRLASPAFAGMACCSPPTPFSLTSPHAHAHALSETLCANAHSRKMPAILPTGLIPSRLRVTVCFHGEECLDTRTTFFRARATNYIQQLVIFFPSALPTFLLSCDDSS
jgi:hypothetical protein